MNSVRVVNLNTNQVRFVHPSAVRHVAAIGFVVQEEPKLEEIENTKPPLKPKK